MHMCLRFKFDLLAPIPLDKTKSDERTSFWNITLAYSILRKSPRYNMLYWKLGGDPFGKRQRVLVNMLILRRPISSLEEIVEKQGDIIAYLKRHNALLSKRLLTFTSSDLDSPPGHL